MKKPHAALAAVAVAGTALGIGTAGSSASAAGTYYGCPRGAVCVYEADEWHDRQPEYVWFSYGGHNLSNEWGEMVIVNNQTQEAGLAMCSGYNGLGDPLPVLYGRWDGGSSATYLSPWRARFVADAVNSVELLPPWPTSDEPHCAHGAEPNPGSGGR